MSKEYIYAVSRIHYREQSLLSKSDIDSLLASHDYESCMRLLLDKGWGDGNRDIHVSDMLRAERTKLWNLIDELVDDKSALNVFRYQVDFQNLKAAVKCTVTNTSANGMLLSGGTIPGEEIADMIKKRDTDDLPLHLKSCADQAFKLILETGNGQLCDMIIDKACLDVLNSESVSEDNDALSEYADVTVACSAIKTAVRCSKTDKSKDFILKALPECALLDKEKLASAAEEGTEAIITYLEQTKLCDGADMLKTSLTSFEKWCDNYIMSKLREQKNEHLSIGPIAAYIIAKENEIKAVRLILSGKLNDINNSIIEERLRDMYV